MKKGVFKSKDPAVILQEIGRWSVKHTPAKENFLPDPVFEKNSQIWQTILCT
jgi:hypothetical protein